MMRTPTDDIPNYNPDNGEYGYDNGDTVIQTAHIGDTFIDLYESGIIVTNSTFDFSEAVRTEVPPTFDEIYQFELNPIGDGYHSMFDNVFGQTTPDVDVLTIEVTYDVLPTHGFILIA